MASSKPKVKFSDKHKALIKENFDVLDDDKDGRIEQDQFATLFRTLGQTITEAALNKIIQGVYGEVGARQQTAETENVEGRMVTKGLLKKEAAQPGGSAAQKPSDVETSFGLSFEEFLDVFAIEYKPPVTEQVLRQAFEVFDETSSGKMSMMKFVEVLTTKGEPLPKKEVDEVLLLANVDQAKNEFDFAELARKLSEGPSGIRSL
eukprot:GHVS01063185.1.p1 GENE.GHVS01063185.1~~GHVS01063185.1.p1  ORF type:complete len:205 (+),score=37.50 GHVS01063185.1:292-906(+)